MWMPTHVQVTVQKATGLLTKGKHNTNDCFVTIALGKTKYQTSVKIQASSTVEWHEECELPIPDHGNTAEIILTVLHRNFLGVDEFLGRVAIPLNSFDKYERPKNQWYMLQAKAGKEGKKKDRGKLEVKITFTVKSGSLSDLNKKEKHKSSIGQLSHVAQSVGGSLLSLGSNEKRKGIRKLAASIGSKMHLRVKVKDSDDDTSIGSVNSLRKTSNLNKKFKSLQTKDDADPGVVSEDEDEFTLDELSNKSSASSLNQLTQIAPNAESPLSNVNKTENKKVEDEWETKLFGKPNKTLTKPSSVETLNRRSWDAQKLESHIEEEPANIVFNVPKQNKSLEIPKKEESGIISKSKNLRKDYKTVDVPDTKNDINMPEFLGNIRYISTPIQNGRNNSNSSTDVESKLAQLGQQNNEVFKKYKDKSKEELLLTTVNLQTELDDHKKKLKDLEDYLDDLLLRVMETTPRILQNPYVTCKMAHKNFS